MATGNLPLNGIVGFGSATSGDDRSLNNFQNIKRAQGTTSQNTLRDFNLWAFNYVKNPGDPLNVLNGAAPYTFSKTRGLVLITFQVTVANETPSKYGTDNNCAAQVQVLGPTTGGLFTVACAGLGSSTTTVNGYVTFNGARSSVWDAGSTRQIAVTYASYSGSQTCTVDVTPGYNNGGGTTVTGSGTAGGAGVNYSSSGNTGLGSKWFLFYSGPRDPSGRPQG